MARLSGATERGEVAIVAAGRGGMLPFLVGTAVGGLAGVVVGVLLGEQVAHAVAGMVGLVDRRGGGGREGEPRFDLLLQ